MPVGQQAAEIAVALPVLDQQQDLRSVLEADLRSCNQVNTRLAGLNMSPDDPVHAVPVGERHGGKAILPAGFDQFLGMAGSFQKGIVALAPEGDVGRIGGGRPGAVTARSQWSVHGFRPS